MAVKIRLARGGAKKRPFYRVVVANATAPRDGDFLEKVGTYDPMLASDNSERVVLKKDRIEYWLGTGAKPTERVAKFIEQTGVTLPEKVKKEMEVKAKNRKARLSKKEAK
ncbi:MAG: 30S ribosomal protein S16 [Rickettsia endosymbiont of Haemaphysalis japonica]